MNDPRRSLDDRELRRLLRGLPTVAPRAEFRERVERAATNRTVTPARHPRSWSWLAAAALALMLVGAASWRWSEVQQDREQQAEIEALRQESDRLAREIHRLRQSADAAPVVYLGGTEDVDYVIDLARLPASGQIRTAGL